MNKRTPQAKKGRPPLPESRKKLASMGFRPTPEIRRCLEEAAKETGVSLSREIEFRLERSFQEEKMRYEIFGNKFKFRLMQILAIAINLIEEQMGKKFTQDLQTHDEVKQAVTAFLDQFAPKNKSRGLRGAYATGIGLKTINELNETILKTLAKKRNGQAQGE